MIKIFLSKNQEFAREKLLQETKKIKGEIFYFDLEQESFLNYLGASSLFGGDISIISKEIGAQEIDEDILKNLASAKNTVFLFGKETIEFQKNLKKIGAEIVNVLEDKKNIKKETSLVFKITDAISKGDKRNAWLYFLEAQKTESVESIHGALLWFFKSLCLYENSLKEKFSHGINPYVVRNFNSAILKINKDRILAIYQKLVFLLTDSRSRGLDANLALENFILKEIFPN